MTKFSACTDSDFSATHAVTSSALRPHFHSSHVVGYLFGGRYCCRLNHSQYLEFRPGEITLLNPGDVHEDFSSTQERDYLTVSIRDRLFPIDANARAPDLPFFFRPRIQADARMRQIFEMLREAVDGHSLERGFLIRDLVMDLAFSILHDSVASSGNGYKCEAEKRTGRLEVRKALEFLQDTYAQKFDLDRLAEIGGLSKYYLERAFKNAVGLSPYQYVLQLRVERAKQLLASTPKSAVEISMELGFFDQSHFSNTFKHFTGISPLAYRTAST